MDLVATTRSLTMSSREIAELTGKPHDNVLRDIRNLGGVITFEEAPYRHPQNGQTYNEYRLTKRDSLILVSGYSAALRARIVDRWLELEAQQAPAFAIPKTLSEALRLAADQAETIERQAAQLEAAKPAVEFVGRYVESGGEKGFREVCKLLKANEARFREFLLAERIMYVLDGKMMPYAPHLDTGRFVVKAGVNQQNGQAFTQAKFTTKGIEYVAGRWTAKLAEAA